MRGPDQVFRSGCTGGIVHRIQFDSAEDLDPVLILVLKAVDLTKILVDLHVDIRIHVTGKAKLQKAELQGLLHHLLRGIGPVTENGMGVEVG